MICHPTRQIYANLPIKGMLLKRVLSSPHQSNKTEAFLFNI